MAVPVTANLKLNAKTVPAILILGGFLMMVLGAGLNVSPFGPETGNALFTWGIVFTLIGVAVYVFEIFILKRRA